MPEPCYNRDSSLPTSPILPPRAHRADSKRRRKRKSRRTFGAVMAGTLARRKSVLTRMSVKDGKIILPDGMSYRALVVPPIETMTPALLAKIKHLADAGAMIVGAATPPRKSPSLADLGAGDEKVQQTAAELVGFRENSYGQNRAGISGRARRAAGFLRRTVAPLYSPPHRRCRRLFCRKPRDKRGSGGRQFPDRWQATGTLVAGHRTHGKLGFLL